MVEDSPALSGPRDTSADGGERGRRGPPRLRSVEEAPADAPRVGFICNADHDVFAAVARRLAAAGVAVEFFEPGRPLGTEALSPLSLLLNKKVDPESVRALAWAERNGLRTWNGYRTVLLGLRLVGYSALERVGFRVPPVHTEPPAGDHVAKTLADWHFHPDPERNGEGDLYQEFVPADPVDDKYYAVDTGERIVVRVLRTTSKLQGEKRPLGLVDPDPALARKVRRLVRLTGSQALGVDVVEAEGTHYAVDVNPAMSFRHAGMEGELAASVLAMLADGPADAGATVRPADGDVGALAERPGTD